MRTKRKKTKRFKFFSSKGSAMIFVLLIAVVVIGSYLLVNGVFTNKSKPPTDTTTYTPITEIPQGSNNNLQLKTIKFGSCGNSAAIGFLVDQSGSMGFITPTGTKEDNLKNALTVFITNFPANGITGLTTFSENVLASVPFDYFSVNKSRFAGIVAGMQPYGGTYTRDAFIYEKQLLDQAKIKFPQYKLNLVFISDGVPETLDSDASKECFSNPNSRYCEIDQHRPGQCRCFDPNQDPTPIATQIKNSGIRIFSIGYVSAEDTKFQNDLQNLMINVASPGDFYPAPIDNQITKILSDISTKICKDQP